jgi:HPt (histidine-containing phosphotransfer) domain-containing protein
MTAGARTDAMTSTTIDPAIFAELQDTAGADFVSELVATFVDEEAPQMLAELRDALAAGSAERFRRAAHSMKSNAMTFGAVPLGELSRTLELGSLPTDSSPVDMLQAELERVTQALKALSHG